MAGIFYASSMSNPPLPDSVDDKTAHTFAYVVLGLTVVRAVARGRPARIGVRIAAIALAITIGYGATDEYHQLFVSNRTSDLFDLQADAIGACIAVVLCWAWGILAIRSDQCGVSP